jgi:hypothetical protein
MTSLDWRKPLSCGLPLIAALALYGVWVGCNGAPDPKIDPPNPEAETDPMPASVGIDALQPPFDVMVPNEDAADAEDGGDGD